MLFYNQNSIYVLLTILIVGKSLKRSLLSQILNVMNIKINREQIYYQLNDILECIDRRDLHTAKEMVNELISIVRN